MKKVATLLALSLAASPLGMSSANAHHHSSSYYYHDHVSTGEVVLAAVLTAGIVVAAASMESQAYAGSSWGVIDTDVKPSDTEVYLDGGYVGVTGKFDGWPGYLPLEPGTYDLEFRRPGFEPFHLKARVLPGQRLVIKKKLHELPPGAPQPGPVPQPRQAPQAAPRPQAPPQSPPDQGKEDGNWRWEEPKSHKAPSTSRGGKGGASPPPAPQAPPQDVPDDSDKAEPPVVSPNPQPEADATPMTELKLEITPADASVYIDGEFYVNARDLEGGERGILLAPGEYKVDVVRPGYKTQSSTVVLGSQSRTLKIRLEKQ